jgi:hypothetical protein
MMRKVLKEMRQASRDYKLQPLGLGGLVAIAMVVAGLHFARHGFPAW